MLFGLVLELFNLQIKFTVKSRAGEPETVVLAAQSWSRLMKRSGAGAAQKKSGTGAAQKKQPGAGAAKIRQLRLRLHMANN